MTAYQRIYGCKMKDLQTLKPIYKFVIFLTNLKMNRHSSNGFSKNPKRKKSRKFMKFARKVMRMDSCLLTIVPPLSGHEMIF